MVEGRGLMLFLLKLVFPFQCGPRVQAGWAGTPSTYNEREDWDRLSFGHHSSKKWEPPLNLCGLRFLPHVPCTVTSPATIGSRSPSPQWKFPKCLGPIHTKACGCYLVCCSCSPTSTIYIYATKTLLHEQIYDETHALTLFLRFFLFLYIQRIENRTSLDLVMVSGSACLLILWLNR